MKPVDQTKFGDPDGNCFNAVLASIFEVSIDEIKPKIGTDPLWFVKFAKFVLDRFNHLMVEFPASWPITPIGYHEIGGPGLRGWDHSCVGKDGEIAHDPHPDKTGVEKKYFVVFIPVGATLQDVLKVSTT